MGQSQSNTAAAIDESSNSNEKSPPPSSSMDSLVAEAVAYGDGDGDGEGENESIDAKAKKALECPCVADLRKGPCGNHFSEAFLCFLKSTAEEKGSDCVNPFVALQSCIKGNPDAFPKEVMEDDQVTNTEQPSPQRRIIPPEWSLESKSPKPRL